MYKIVFFDLDGTLLNREKIISPGVKRAIQDLRENGILPVIATGRPPYYIQQILAELKIDSYVGINGNYVVHEGAVIYENPIPPSTLERFVHFANRHDHPLIYFGAAEDATNNAAHPHLQKTVSALKIQSPMHQDRYWKEKPVYQVIYHAFEEFDPIYGKEFPDLKFTRWDAHAVDANTLGSSKAMGIEKTLARLGIAKEEAVAFGDALNDIEMLAYVGMGIAMGNGHEKTKQAANLVTRSVDEDGVVHALQQLRLI